MPRSVGRVGPDTVGIAKFASPIPTNVYVEGFPVVVVDTPIVPHGKGIHGNPANMMAVGDLTIRVGPDALPICATGHIALCGEPLVSTSKVFIK